MSASRSGVKEARVWSQENSSPARTECRVAGRRTRPEQDVPVYPHQWSLMTIHPASVSQDVAEAEGIPTSDMHIAHERQRLKLCGATRHVSLTPISQGTEIWASAQN